MKIELNYIGYGHTNTMLVARFPEQRLSEDEAVTKIEAMLPQYK